MTAAAELEDRSGTDRDGRRGALPATQRSAGTMLAIGIGVLVSGLAIDLGFTRPQVVQLRALETAQARVQARAAERAGHDREGRAIARALGAEDLASALAAQRGEDPIDYLGQKLVQSRLRRLQLTARTGGGSGPVRQSAYSLRVAGTYEEILAFVRFMELGTRVAAIQSISIAPGQNPAELEAWIDVSLCNLPGGGP